MGRQFVFGWQFFRAIFAPTKVVVYYWQRGSDAYAINLQLIAVEDVQVGPPTTTKCINYLFALLGSPCAKISGASLNREAFFRLRIQTRCRPIFIAIFLEQKVDFPVI